MLRGCVDPPLAVFIRLQSLSNLIHRLLVARGHEHGAPFNVCGCEGGLKGGGVRGRVRECVDRLLVTRGHEHGAPFNVCGCNM